LALADLIEKPRIIHRDHRLRREIFEQCDLFVGEWPYLAAAGSDVAEQGAILAQWDHKHRADTGVQRRPVYRASWLRSGEIRVMVQALAL
jgi:hypothetical protein